MSSPYFIVGGGIIGMLCARELLQAGKAVVLLDRQAVGQESSWAGGGILSPLYPWRYPASVNALAFWSQHVYPGLCQSVHTTTGIDPEWLPSGLLVLQGEDFAIAEKWAKDNDITANIVELAELRKLEPALGNAPREALWMPEIAQVRNPRLVAGLRQELLQSGCEIREDVTITGFKERSGRLAALLTSQGPIAAHRCVLAVGAWTAQLLKDFPACPPIEPVRGQILLFKTKPGLISHILLHAGHYVIPRRDGRILAGSTLEYKGFDKTITPQARQELYQAAIKLVPALANEEIERQWAGLRPGSPQGVPFIGQHPDIDGLIVCSGHFRNGFVLGPASARLAIDLLLERDPCLDPKPYGLSR